MRLRFAIPLFLMISLLGFRAELRAGTGICFASSSVFGDVLTSIGANGRDPFPYSDLLAFGSIEALALSPDATTIYAVDLAQFGFIDLSGIGGFVPIGGGLGVATGSAGMIPLDDVDGMDFDTTTGILYATQRRNAVEDLLFRIDPILGTFVAGAFGGDDYVIVSSTTVGPNFLDVDDLALDPSSGQMYASVTDDMTGESRLVLVDKATGAVTDVGGFMDAAGTAIFDMEGLTFSPGGTLYGTTGDFSVIDLSPPENSLWTIDPASARVRLAGPLATSDPPFFDIDDYEGLACLDTTGHRISGYVFADNDLDGIFEPGDGELGQAGVFVRLYEDFLGDGMLDCCDAFLYSVVTDANGFYEFDVFPTGDYLVATDFVTYPAGVSLTTGNLETASFSSAADPDDTGNNFGFDMGPITPSPLGVCYSVADDGDFLTAFGTLGYGPVLVGDLDPMFGGLSVEAIAFDANGVLFATDADKLGTIDLGTGLFTALGPPVGTGNGAEGMLPFDDVDGLEFDPLTGFLYGTVRRDGDNDLLIRIDPVTGLFVPNAFGAGVDYVVMDTIDLLDLPDVEDIAIDPSDGQMYGAAQDDGLFDTLILIDKSNGDVADVDIFTNFDDELIEDVEGLTFGPDGKLYATTGNFSDFPLNPPENTFYLVDKATAHVTELGLLITDNDPIGDYESIACLAVGNLISGFVFGDDDLDGIFEPGSGEAGYPGALVSLYSDDDGSGDISAGDALLGQTPTAADGSYQFGAPAFGDFLLRIDTSGLPVSAVLTTDNLETAMFAAFTDPDDTDNNFGFSVADVSVTKTAAGASYTPGSTLVFTVEVTNSGPLDASNVMVSDPAPAGTTISGWTCSASGGAACPNAGGVGDLNETVVSLPNGGTLTYLVTIQIPADFLGTLSNTVTVSSDTADPDNGDLSATAEAVAGAAVADVSVTKVADDLIYVPGLSTSFTVVVSNDGPSNASNVQISDSAPAGTMISGWTCMASGGGTCPNASGSGNLSESVPLLPPGAGLTYQITVSVPADYSGTLVNSVNVSSSTSDPDSGDLSAMASIGTSAPRADIEVIKTATNSYYLPGFTTPFAVEVRNLGPSHAANVTVTDLAPAGTTVESWSCVGSAGAVCPNASGSGDLNESIPLLPAGASVTYTLLVKSAAGSTAPIVNVATASSSAGDPNPDNNSSSASIEGQPPSSVPFLGIPSLALLAAMLGLAGWCLLPVRKL